MILNTISHKLFTMRVEADEDGSLLDLTSAGDFASKPAAALDLFEKDIITPGPVLGRPELVPNGLGLMFTGGSAANKTFGWRLLAWLNENGPARLVAVGTGILGTQAVVKWPHTGIAASNKFWADTLTVTFENWPKTLRSNDTTGHNTMTDVWFDSAGWRFWYVEITDADGSTGDEAGDIAVWYWYF